MRVGEGGNSGFHPPCINYNACCIIFLIYVDFYLHSVDEFLDSDLETAACDMEHTDSECNNHMYVKRWISAGCGV